jgi:hypothetical protein
MKTPAEEYESRANRDVIEPDHPCRKCLHPAFWHANSGECHYSMPMIACDCSTFEPATRDDLESEGDE